MTTPNAWSLLVQGDDRTHGGDGYEDRPDAAYLYDSTVQNRKRLLVGTFVVIRRGDEVLGTAVIQDIASYPGRKDLAYCPTCGKPAQRTRDRSSFRCAARHVFATPELRSKEIVVFEARYGDTYVRARDHLSRLDLKPAELHEPGSRLSIRPLDLSRLAPQVRRNLGLPSVPRDATTRTAEEVAAYVVAGEDQRRRLLRALRVRQGQPGFRLALRQRYGDACMVSGCEEINVVEAAHIEPYRGPASNHPENGLLLRSDLHSLFDLDLLGVEPEGLGVYLGPDISDPSYRVLDGETLKTPVGARPSRDALATRWKAFVSESNRGRRFARD